MFITPPPGKSLRPHARRRLTLNAPGIAMPMLSTAVRCPRQGLTRVEALVLLGIVFVAATLAVPLLQTIRESSHRQTCVANLRQIGLATLQVNDEQGRLPPALGWLRLDPQGERAARLTYGNVLCHLIPYLGEEKLVQSGSRSRQGVWCFQPWEDDMPSTPVRVFLCPANPSMDATGITDVGWAASCYAYNGQVFAQVSHQTGHVLDWNGATRLPADFVHGTSRTLLFAEKYPRCHDFGSLWASCEKDKWQPAFAV